MSFHLSQIHYYTIASYITPASCQTETPTPTPKPATAAFNFKPCIVTSPRIHHGASSARASTVIARSNNWPRLPPDTPRIFLPSLNEPQILHRRLASCRCGVQIPNSFVPVLPSLFSHFACPAFLTSTLCCDKYDMPCAPCPTQNQLHSNVPRGTFRIPAAFAIASMICPVSRHTVCNF